MASAITNSRGDSFEYAGFSSSTPLTTIVGLIPTLVSNRCRDGDAEARTIEGFIVSFDQVL